MVVVQFVGFFFVILCKEKCLTPPLNTGQSSFVKWLKVDLCYNQTRYYWIKIRFFSSTHGQEEILTRILQLFPIVWYIIKILPIQTSYQYCTMDRCHQVTFRIPI